MPELNEPAPDFELPDLTGEIHRLSDERGRIAVVNFWSAECAWSERVDRELVRCLARWGGRVALLTVAANPGEMDEALEAAAGERSLPFVLRGSRQVLQAYDARITPQLFVVDANGLLRYRGAFDDVTFQQRVATRSYLEEAVEALLAGRFPDPAETVPYGCAIVHPAGIMLE